MLHNTTPHIKTLHSQSQKKFGTRVKEIILKLIYPIRPTEIATNFKTITYFEQNKLVNIS